MKNIEDNLSIILKDILTSAPEELTVGRSYLEKIYRGNFSNRIDSFSPKELSIRADVRHDECLEYITVGSTKVDIDQLRNRGEIRALMRLLYKKHLEITNYIALEYAEQICEQCLNKTT